jgi:hypothetical protein
MARLNFVKGSIKGRVGEFVGSSWKGTDYIKTYTPPSNPRSAGQVAVRTVFQHCGHIGKQINQEVLHPYTFPKPQKMSAYNYLFKVNTELFSHKTWEPGKFKIFEGPLYNPGIISAAIENAGTPTASVKVTFTGTMGNGTDKAIAVIYDEASEKALAAVGDRQDGQITVPIGSIDPADMGKLHAYLVFSTPPAANTAETGQVSVTAYRHITVP